jgi:hypothetical protein
MIDVANSVVGDAVEGLPLSVSQLELAEVQSEQDAIARAHAEAQHAAVAAGDAVLDGPGMGGGRRRSRHGKSKRRYTQRKLRRR